MYGMQGRGESRRANGLCSQPGGHVGEGGPAGHRPADVPRKTLPPHQPRGWEGCPSLRCPGRRHGHRSGYMSPGWPLVTFTLLGSMQTMFQPRNNPPRGLGKPISQVGCLCRFWARQGSRGSERPVALHAWALQTGGALPSCKAGGAETLSHLARLRGQVQGEGAGTPVALAPGQGGHAGVGPPGRRGGARAGRMLRSRDVGDVTARPGRSRRIAWSRRPPSATVMAGRTPRAGPPAQVPEPRAARNPWRLRVPLPFPPRGQPTPGRWDGAPYRPISQMGTETALEGDPDPARPALPEAGPAPLRPGLIRGA